MAVKLPGSMSLPRSNGNWFCVGQELLWMDEILQHFETMGNHCLLVFTEESSFQGFLGAAGFRPSTVVPPRPFLPSGP